MKALLAALWLGAVTAVAATAEYDPAVVLKQVTEKVIAGIARTPNHTCVQTVNRQYYHPVASTLRRPCGSVLELRRHPTPDMVVREAGSDRLRLDVTLNDQGEIYSWAGASQFEDRIDKVVTYGPLGTGAYGALLSVVFRRDVKHFRFERKLVQDGHVRLEYSFRVQESDSHYRVILPSKLVYTAYHGTFVADAETAQLVRITVETAELPAASGSCMTSSTMDLTPGQIGGTDLLLPVQMRQRFVAPNGDETENTTQFNQCREYRGDSTITYVEGSGEAPPGAIGKTPLTKAVDPGLRFRFELLSPIDTGRAAAGDRFTGRLTDALRDRRGKLVAPKGAAVSGRLLRVQVDLWPRRESVVVMQPEMVGQLAVRAWRMAVGRGPIELPMAGEDGVGAFRFNGAGAVVPKGFRTDWQTAYFIAK